jgi:hypothetical protein
MMQEPLFILAPPRSYTSVVCAMLGNHPQMCGLPETNLFAAETYSELSRLYNVRPRFQHGLLRAIAELGLGGQTEENIETARRWLEENPALTTFEIFQDIRNWADPRAVIEKSPMFVFKEGALERIIDYYPNARFLHLTRHPRGTCESNYETRKAQRRGGGNTDGPLGGEAGDIDPDSMWLLPHLRIIAALEKVPLENHMMLRGEAFMETPRVYLPQLCEWLQIDASDPAIDAMMRPEQSPFARMGPANAPLGNDPRFLKEPALRPYKEKPSDLDSPLSWDPSLVFDDVVQHYAMLFGY